MFAALGFVLGVVAEVDERVVALGRFHENITAAPTIAARGPAALHGLARAAAAGLAGAVAGAALGTLVSAGLPVTGFLPNAGVAVLAAATAAAAFGATALILDQGDLRAVAARLMRRRQR